MSSLTHPKPRRARPLRRRLLFSAALLSALFIARHAPAPTKPRAGTPAQHFEDHLQQASVASRARAQQERQAALAWQACLTPAEAAQIKRHFPAQLSALRREEKLLVTPPQCPASP